MELADLVAIQSERIIELEEELAHLWGMVVGCEDRISFLEEAIKMKGSSEFIAQSL